MNRQSFQYSAPLLVALATFFLLSGCLPDKEKAANERRERLQQQIIAANELLHAGEANRAIAQLEKLEQANPDSPQVLEALGFAYAGRPDPLMAAMYFDHTLRLLPDRADLALHLAQAHIDSGQNDLATDAYRAYLALTPTDAAAWRRLGELEYDLQRSKPALDAYLEVLRFSNAAPSAEDALRLGRLYHTLGNQPQAGRWYAQVLSHKDATAEQRADALLGEFDIALRNRQWLAAVSLMEQLEALAPEKLSDGPYAQAYAELSAWNDARKQQIAEAEAKQKAAEEVTAAAKKSAGTTEATTENRQKTEAASHAAGSATDEREAGADADQQESGDTAAREKSGAATTMTQQKRDDAAGAATAAGQQKGGGATTTDGKAAAGAPEGETSTAAGETTVTTDAQAAAAASGKAQDSDARTQDDATAEATTATQNAATEATVPADAQEGKAQENGSPTPPPSDPADPVSDGASAELAARGAAAFEKGDYAEAAELLERSVKLNPNNGKTLDQLSRAFYRTGDYPQAERYATLAIYAEPKNLSYRLEYLRAYQRNNPPPALLQQMISAKEDFPNAPAVTLALARGYEHIAQRKSLAARIYREYLEQAPDSPHAKEIRQKLLEWEM